MNDTQTGCLTLIAIILVFVGLIVIGQHFWPIYLIAVASVIAAYWWYRKRRRPIARPNRHRSRPEREAAASADQATKSETMALLHGTHAVIETATSRATTGGDSLWLSALLVLRQDCNSAIEDLQSGRISVPQAKVKLADLSMKAQALSFPPPKKDSRTPTGLPDYYEILGIGRHASTGQIRDIYRRLALIYHPDTGKSLGVDSDERFKLIQEAFETLVDPGKRKEYDRKIGA